MQQNDRNLADGYTDRVELLRRDQRRERHHLAIDESSVILLQPPSTFCRCFNPDKQGDAIKMTEISPTASSITPPPSPLPMTTMSGTTLNCSNVKNDPVRPREFGICKQEGFLLGTAGRNCRQEGTAGRNCAGTASKKGCLHNLRPGADYARACLKMRYGKKMSHTSSADCKFSCSLCGTFSSVAHL